MWKNEHRRTIILNIIIFLVLVLAVVGLFMAMVYVNKQIDEEDKQLQAENASQRQELIQNRQENQEAVQQTYQSHLQMVSRYLPGIVCRGDSLTAGSSGNVSYPATLQKYIDAYLCSAYDLRYSLENRETASRLKKEDYKISIPVVNMGAGKEDINTILGRSGVVPYVVDEDFTIPAGRQSVEITLASQNGKDVSPLTAGSAGVNPVTIAGVRGSLTLDQNKGVKQYLFTRSEDGAEVTVTKGTEIITACKDEYRDYIHIVWVGSYGEFISAEKLVTQTKQLLQRQQMNSDRYLVIGPCTINGSWYNTSKNLMDTIDSAMLQAFGNRYINLRKYLIEDGLRDAGISATKEDTANITQGSIPNSFRSNAGGADLNAVAYELLGKLVYSRMESLGFFDELTQVLNLEQTTQELLKSDPQYFERLLK